MKKALYIMMSILGLIGFIGMYVIVCLVKEENFAGLKYLIMVIGYLSIVLFCGGFLMLIKKKKEVKENVKR